jgi:hypothetical protein
MSAFGQCLFQRPENRMVDALEQNDYFTTKILIEVGCLPAVKYLTSNSDIDSEKNAKYT